MAALSDARSWRPPARRPRYAAGRMPVGAPVLEDCKEVTYEEEVGTEGTDGRSIESAGLVTTNGGAPVFWVHAAGIPAAAAAAVAFVEPVETRWRGEAVAVVGGELMRGLRALER